MKLSKEEWEVFLKVQKFSSELWNEYLEVIDPKKELKVEIKELIRVSFASGVSFAMDSFYEGIKEKGIKDKE